MSDIEKAKNKNLFLVYLYEEDNGASSLNTEQFLEKLKFRQEMEEDIWAYSGSPRRSGSWDFPFLKPGVSAIVSYNLHTTY